MGLELKPLEKRRLYLHPLRGVKASSHWPRYTSNVQWHSRLQGWKPAIGSYWVGVDSAGAVIGLGLIVWRLSCPVVLGEDKAQAYILCLDIAVLGVETCKSVRISYLRNMSLMCSSETSIFNCIFYIC